MSTNRRRKTSLLGCLSLIAGVVALLATRVSLGGVGPVTIGVVGAAIGLLGFLGAILIGHAGRVLPIVATIVCLAAAGYGLMLSGRADGVGPRVTGWINSWRADGAPAGATNGNGTTGGGATASGHRPSPPDGVSGGGPSDSGGSVGHGSIFDVNAPGTPESSIPKNNNLAPSNPIPGTSAPLRPDPSTLAALRTRAETAQAAVQTAKAKLDAVQKSIVAGLSSQPAYQSAKSEVTAAETGLAAVRDTSGPGSETLVAASKRVLDAKTALQKVIASASSTDPTVTAAQRELSDAQHALASIKSEQEALLKKPR